MTEDAEDYMMRKPLRIPEDRTCTGDDLVALAEGWTQMRAHSNDLAAARDAEGALFLFTDKPTKADVAAATILASGLVAPGLATALTDDGSLADALDTFAGSVAAAMPLDADAFETAAKSAFAIFVEELRRART